MSDQNVAEVSQEFEREASEHEFTGNFEDGTEEVGPGGPPAPGMGQSKSSKRRRRKRKKLAATGSATPMEMNGEGGEALSGTAPAGAAYAPVVMEGESLALSASAAAPPSGMHARRAGMNNGQMSGSNGQSAGQGTGQSQGPGQGQGQGQGKRWKKKFRDRERRVGREGGAPGQENTFKPQGSDRPFHSDRGFDRPFRREGGRPDNFGNLVSHQERKPKGGGGKERGFVGPMDHSYREVHSEFGDAPPSTIQLRGRRGHRHQGDNQPIDHNAPRPIPIAEDAQTHIYLFVEDLFVTAKVQETARKLGVKVAFIKNEKEALAELTSGEDQNRPSLIVFDLNNASAKPLTLIPKLKSKLKRSASIIGFLSTIQGDLKAKAVEAGCDTVMPKAAFSQNLPNLLRRYGGEDAEEINYNY